MLFDFLYREPDVTLYTPSGEPYLKRWWLIRPGAYWGFNIYLHHFLSSDEDRALHDHPWWSLSFLLNRSYLEYLPKNQDKWTNENDREEIIKKRYPLIPIYRDADCIHRIELINDKPVWTLFITGPKIKEWGFWCPFGFRHNNDFLDPSGSSKGKGCGD